MCTLQKPVAVLVCVLLVCFSFLSLLLAGSHADHSCRKPDYCTICAALQSVSTTMRRILASLLQGFAAFLALCIGMMPVYRQGACCHARTLVSLKVRLNP